MLHFINPQVTFFRPKNKDISFAHEERFKGSIVNYACPSQFEGRPLKMTLTVHLVAVIQRVPGTMTVGE